MDHNKLWEILREMGIPEHLTCLLKNLYAGQEATVRTGYGTTDWFQIGKGVYQGYILLPCLFMLYAEHIMRNAGLEEAQAVIKIAERTINHLRCFSCCVLRISLISKVSIYSLDVLFPIWNQSVVPCPVLTVAS